MQNSPFNLSLQNNGQTLMVAIPYTAAKTGAIRIWDTRGKRMYFGETHRITRSGAAVDVSHFPAGVYLMKVQCAGSLLSSSFVMANGMAIGFQKTNSIHDDSRGIPTGEFNDD